MKGLLLRAHRSPSKKGKSKLSQGSPVQTRLSTDSIPAAWDTDMATATAGDWSTVKRQYGCISQLRRMRVPDDNVVEIRTLYYALEADQIPVNCFLASVSR